MRSALYAGTFDIVTHGHVWVVTEGLNLFDRVVIGVANNPKKKPLLSLIRRMQLWETILDNDIPYPDRSHVEIVPIENCYTVQVAKQLKCHWMLRGIRTAQDYQDEVMLQGINYDIDPDVRPVYLMAPPNLKEVSSSMVKGLVGFEGWQGVVRKYVPEISALELTLHQTTLTS